MALNQAALLSLWHRRQIEASAHRPHPRRPTGAWQDPSNLDSFLQRGYAVFYPNIRGSSGYGQKSSNLIAATGVAAITGT